MADRSVLVSLRADVRDFVTQMKRATQASEDVGKKTKETGEEASSAMGQLVASASEASDAWESVGAVLTVSGGSMAAGVLVASNAFAEFDEAMSTVAADTHETTENLGLMREAALEAGADTKYSATEAAAGIDELAKAGVATTDVLDGGLSGALSLAAAGGLDVADAAEIAATALTQFELKGSDVGHVADLLAAGAGKAQGSVQDLGMALNQGGLVASQMGLSIEETTGTLAAMASAGLVGSDAGTSLKTSLLMLANPSEKAATLMADLGIKAYDASGQFVGMASLAGQLQARLGGLTQEQRDAALATIFGSDAIRAANVLYSEGSMGIAGWTTRVDDAGYAATTAATKMDNLRGDLEMLKGALDTALINTGAGGDGFLRQQVQSLEALVDAYNRLPEPAQRATFGLAGSTAAVLLAGGAFLSVAPRVLEMSSQFKELNASGSKIPGVFKKVAIGAGVLIALAAAGAALSVYTDAAEGAIMSSSEATAMLARTTSTVASIDASVKGLSTGDGNGFDSLADGLKNLADPSVLDRLNDTSASILSFTGLYSSKGRPERAAFIEQLGAMGEGLANLAQNGAADQAADHFAAISEQAAAAGISQEQLLDLMPQYRDALKDQETQQTLAATSGDSLASAVTGVAEQTEDAAAASEKFSDALDSLLAQFFDVDAASDAFQSSLHDLAAAAKDNGRAVEGNSEKAIANREAMRSSAEAAADLLRAMAEQGYTSDEIAGKAAELKQQFLDQAAAAGFTGAEVDKVAAAYDAMPSLVKTQIVADGLDTMLSQVLSVQRAVTDLDGRKIRVTTVFEGGTAPIKNFSGAGVQVARADGGLIPLGLGGPRQDNVLLAASSGEYVVNAAQTAQWLPLLEAINSGTVERRADGGLLGGGLGARGAASSTSTSATSSAGLSITAASLLAGMTASDVNRGAAGDYAAALDAQAAAAARAARAEEILDTVRAKGEARLDTLKTRFEAAEEAQKAAQEAALEQADTDLDALKRRNDDALQALKDRNDAELEALKARTKDQARINALSKAQDAAEKDLARRQDDEETAAQDRIKEAKKANTRAAKELAAANEEAYDTAKARAAAEQESATKALSAAKEADAAASRAAAEAERLLNEQRQKAAAFANAAADAVRRNATLTAALTDSTAKSLSQTGAALQQASAGADDAARARRDETAAAAASRRAAALSELTDAAVAYATAQRAYGADEATIGAGLDQVAAKLSDLGARYGLTATQVQGLTGKLNDQRVTAEGLLSNFTRQASLSAELASSLAALQTGGLSDALVDQVIGSGNALQLARTILAGGVGLINSLNAQQNTLDAYANGVGSQLAANRYGSAIYSPTGMPSRVATAVLSPEAMAVLTAATQAIASRPNLIKIGEREVVEVVTDAVLASAEGTYAR